MNDQTIDEIFAGNMKKLPPISSKIVRIFTSSTFTDTQNERNLLMERVYPKIKEYCRERHGLEFQVVDMRWGVRDEATDDHLTTQLCMEEIKNCQKISIGPNFVVFLGQKYGYRPIPTFIDSLEFFLIKNALIELNVDHSLLDTWYKEDVNSTPEVFVLQPISSILVNYANKRIPKLQTQDQNAWWEMMCSMQKLLRQAAKYLHDKGVMDDEELHNYIMSVTEREVINGILKADDTRNNCLAFVRLLENVDYDDVKTVSKFVDISEKKMDEEASRLLKSLRDEKLGDKLDQKNIKSFCVDWAKGKGVDLICHNDYLELFCKNFFKRTTKLIDRAMRKEEVSTNTAATTEILQHLHSCVSSSKYVFGRRKQLDVIEEYLKSASDIPLIVHGIGGSGKSCLLAKAASLPEAMTEEAVRPAVVVRFLGTTPASSSIGSLMVNLCQQLCYNYLTSFESIPDELVPLTAFFRKLLKNATREQPLFIFLDSIEQLGGQNDANRLSWLPLVLPPHVKFVVSVLSEDKCKDYQLLKQVIGTGGDNFVEVNKLDFDDALLCLNVWLKEARRSVTAKQFDVVKTALRKCSLPIYVKLVFSEIVRWKSYSRFNDTTIASTVLECILRLFDRIEVQHGKTLVCHALAYITVSRSGVSESELEDLLSLDDRVLEDVYQYHLPPIRRIPPLLWTRIRNDLPNYLTTRDADGISVLNWHHRQFAEAASKRYFKNLNTLNYFHSCLADYFLGTWGGGRAKPFRYTEIQRQRFSMVEKGGEADRKVPSQRLYHMVRKNENCRYNLRKLGELPYHLIRSNRFNDLFEQVLFNYSWLHCKLKVCGLQAILTDFDDAFAYITNKQEMKDLLIVADALRLSGSTLSMYPDMLAACLLSRLLPMMHTHPFVTTLLEQCDEFGPEDCALIPINHCLHTPGGPLKYTLEGQNFAVFGFRITADHRYVLSVANKFVMWDLSTGEISRNINPGIQGIMQDLCMSPDNKTAAAFTTNDQIVILDMLSGQLVILDGSTMGDGDSRDFDGIQGIQLNDEELIFWNSRQWVRVCLKTKRILQKYSTHKTSNIIMTLIFLDQGVYFVVERSENSQNRWIEILPTINNPKVQSLKILDAFSFDGNHRTLYTYLGYEVMNDLAVLSFDGGIWKENMRLNFPNSEDRVQALLLKGEKSDILVAVVYAAFYTLDIGSKKTLRLSLPNDVKNIATRIGESQSSLVLTKENQYAIAGVRKCLYVWEMVGGQFLKAIDSHFGRIIRLEALVDVTNNAIISSSIDRTVKLWSVKNIFENVHTVDRHEMAVTDLMVVAQYNLIVTVTRCCIGLWNMLSGELLAKLADSPVGAIVSHAVITSDARYIVSSESDFLISWKLDTYQVSVVSKKSEANVQHLILTTDNRTIFVVSKDQQKNLARFSARKTISLSETFSFTYHTKKFQAPILTSDSANIVVTMLENGRDCIQIRETKRGQIVYKFVPKKFKHFKEIFQVVPLKSKPSNILLMQTDRALVYDIKTKKIGKTYSKLNGSLTSDDRLGIYQSPRGGVELIELKDGLNYKILSPRSDDSVSKVNARFSKCDDYVIYCRTGKKILRVCRVDDGKEIAKYHLSADITCFEPVDDSNYVIVGAADGSVTALLIIDPKLQDKFKSVQDLPSRQKGAKRNLSNALTFKMAANMARLAVRTSRMMQRDNIVLDNEPSTTCSVS